MTTKPTTEAVDALSRAARLSFDDGVFAPHEFIRSLSEDGFSVQRLTPEAPTQGEVNIAINRLENFSAPQGDHYADTIRAYIASQSQQMEKANRNALTEVTRLCKLLNDSRAEVDRLREALHTVWGRIINTQIGLSTGETKQGAIDEMQEIICIINATLNPEQKGGV